jgi:ABC-2 type transport system ATP-binding protein
VELTPAGGSSTDAYRAILARFGELVESTRGVAVRLDSTEATLAEIVRALDAEDLQVENLQLHQASLDDVFLAKTGHSLEGSSGAETGSEATR